MSRTIVASLAVVASMIAADVRAEDVGEDDICGAVVRVLAIQQAPDWLKPWAKAPHQMVWGSGAVIDGQRILTNAHLVMYASQVHVQPYQSSNQIPARLTALAWEVDLALLDVEDNSFAKSCRALPMASTLPRVRDTVSTYGYPVGGIGLSTTKGIVSRIEYGADGLRVEVSANLNPGDSGGPAVADGRMIGLVYGVGYPNPNTGYIIPTEEIGEVIRSHLKLSSWSW